MRAGSGRRVLFPPREGGYHSGAAVGSDRRYEWFSTLTRSGTHRYRAPLAEAGVLDQWGQRQVRRSGYLGHMYDLLDASVGLDALDLGN